MWLIVDVGLALMGVAAAATLLYGAIEGRPKAVQVNKGAKRSNGYSLYL